MKHEILITFQDVTLVSQNPSILDSCASYGCQNFRYILALILIFFSSVKQY